MIFAKNPLEQPFGKSNPPSDPNAFAFNFVKKKNSEPSPNIISRAKHCFRQKPPRRLFAKKGRRKFAAAKGFWLEGFWFLPT
jgi:hypothetical protein